MDKLKLNNSENYEFLCNVKLSKDKYPIAFENKIEELLEQGFETREAAEKYISETEIELELYYHKGYGVFAVETDAVENGCDIFSPYNGKEYQGWEQE